MKWLQFLRQYGPVTRNDNMYDETIQRSACRAKAEPILFEHPVQKEVVGCFDQPNCDPVSVILTGTAGDGKTHLCRQVWNALNGDPDAWASDDPYLSLLYAYPKDRKEWPTTDDPELYRQVTIHFIRDLSGWAPQQGLDWDPEKEKLLQRLCESLFDPTVDEVFLIAANDGQLIESWRRLGDTPEVLRARRFSKISLWKIASRRRAFGYKCSTYPAGARQSCLIVRTKLLSHIPGGSRVMRAFPASMRPLVRTARSGTTTSCSKRRC